MNVELLQKVSEEMARNAKERMKAAYDNGHYGEYKKCLGIVGSFQVVLEWTRDHRLLEEDAKELGIMEESDDRIQGA